MINFLWLYCKLLNIILFSLQKLKLRSLRQCLKYPQNGGNFRQILIDYSNGINNN